MIAQHREVHTAMGSVLSKHHTGFRNHPVTKLYLGEHLQCLVDYHERSVSEMVRRGWTGHATPVDEQILVKAEERRTDATCHDWLHHVEVAVPAFGQFSIDADVHDLIERWTNENKHLRNDLAAHFVSGHALQCPEACCVTYAHSLVAEFDDRKRQQEQGALIPTKGNASLRGKLELLGVL